MAEQKPPEPDAEKSIRAVKYEYDMALATVQRSTRSWDDAAMEFALLESFLVHARNLHEFLRPRNESSHRRPGDIWASDLVDGFGYTVFDREMVDAINRWLQHITTWRYANDHAQWPALEMLAQIHAGMGAFIARADSSLVVPLASTHAKVEQVLRSADLIDD